MHKLSFSSLTLRYVVALTLIAILSFISYLNMNQLIQSEQKTAELINLSGRQRMLTQKMALYSVGLSHEADSQRRIWLRSQLTATTTEIETAQLRLSERGHGLPSEVGDKISTYITTGYEFAALPDAGFPEEAENKAKWMEQTAGELLRLIDNVVNQQQKESEDRIKRLLYLQGIGVGATFLVLLLEALFLFRPMISTIRRETEQLVGLNQTLDRLSSLDGLTGIANRRYYDDYLNREWLRGVREGTGLSVVFIDVDHFKLFNDTYGHQGGDDCLRKVAAELQCTLKRPTDLVARYGGEEFAVILPQTDENGAFEVAEQIRKAIENLHINHVSSPVSPWVTVSMGVASLNVCQEGRQDTLLAAADQALYQAKFSGRNQVKVANKVIPPTIIE